MEFHEVANIFPMMSAEEFDALLADMARNGYDETAPIVLLDGKILDGRNRYKAADELGIIPVYTEYTGDDPLGFVVRHNLNRRHLNTSQRAVIAARLANMTRQDTLVSRVIGGGYRSANLHNDKVSQEEAAEMLNVSPRIVASAKEIELEAPELIPAIESGEMTVHGAKREIENRKQAAFPHVAYNSGNNEWYTPQEYIEAARRVLGVIDLDPASSVKANEIVQAETYYTIETNGLEHKWFGRVWMNPPYSGRLIGEFTAKLASHYLSGDITEAIVLVNNATETIWFQTMLEISSAVCFLKGRIKYLNINHEPAEAPLQGQAILYFGGNKESFSDVFSGFGVVMYAR